MPNEKKDGSLLPALAIGGIGAAIMYAVNRTLPNPRRLTAVEMFVLQPFVSKKNDRHLLSQDGLDTAVLHFDAQMPAMGGEVVEAYTNETGIYFPFRSHEFKTAEGYALLAHELLHWCHYIDSGKLHESCTEEMPAYQLQMTVWQYLSDEGV